MAHIGCVCRQPLSVCAETWATPGRTAVNVADAGPGAGYPTAESNRNGCSGAVTESGAAARGAVQPDPNATRRRCPTIKTSAEPLASSPTVFIGPPADGVDGTGVALLVPPLAVLARLALALAALPLPTLPLEVPTPDGTALDVRTIDAVAAPDETDDGALDRPATVPAFEPQPLASTTLSATAPRTARRPIPKPAIRTT